MSFSSDFKKWSKTISKIKNWPSYENWSNFEFNTLSAEIFEKTKKQISRNTFRNLIQNLEKGDEYNPQKVTKDALANYIGYHNWQEFSLRNRRKSLTKRLVRSMSVVGFLIIVFVFFNIVPQKSPGEFKFEIKNPEGIAPHTLKCEYDFSNVNSKNIYIDFRHVDHKDQYLLKKTDKNKDYLSQCFHFPGIYNIRLFIDQKRVKTSQIVVNTEGWFAFARNAEADYIEVPSFVNPRGVSNPRRVLYDNVLKKNITPKGYFHIPKSKIEAIEGLSSNYSVHVQNIKDYGVSVRNIGFRVRFKNEDFGESFYCSDVRIRLQGRKGNISVKFSESGCSQYNSIRVGSYSFSGKKEDLDFLNLNFKDFREVFIESNPKSVNFFVDNERIKEIDHEEELGELIGISLDFKDSPHIDFVELTHGEDKQDTVFVDHFNYECR